MPVSVDWYDKNESILIYHFEGTWKLNEFHEAINTAEKLLKEHTGRLDVISDLTSTKGYDKSVRGSEIQAAMNRSFKILPDELGYAIVVGAALGVKIMIDLLAKVYGPMKKHVRTSNTVEDALEMIKKEREKETQESG